MEITIKQKIALISLTIAGITLAIILIVIIPTVNEIKTINQSIYNERVDLEKKYQRGQLLRQTVEDFEKIKPVKQNLSNVFLEIGQELSLITSLENIAANNNLNQRIQVQSQPTSKKDLLFQTLPLKIILTGDFQNIMNYLGETESLPNMLTIKSFVITKNNDNRIQATLDAEIYLMAKH